MAAQDPMVSEGAARSVQGAQGGLQQASVTTTPHAFDVSSWKGRYIKFNALGDAFYWLFSTSSATVPDATTNRTTFNATVPDYAAAGEAQQEVVPLTNNPDGKVYLIVRAVTGTLTRAWVRPV